MGTRLAKLSYKPVEISRLVSAYVVFYGDILPQDVVDGDLRIRAEKRKVKPKQPVDPVVVCGSLGFPGSLLNEIEI